MRVFLLALPSLAAVLSSVVALHAEPRGAQNAKTPETQRLTLSGKTQTSGDGAAPSPGKLESDESYRGIWYYNEPTRDEYKYKYSGGFATYPQQQEPIAIYRKEVDKTFFVFGGTTAHKGSDKQELLHMVSYYDHKTGQLPRPRILLNKRTSDAHDNPTLQVDAQGYLWV